MPNKSPEPTAVGAVRSAIAVHVVSRRWLSFLRWAADHGYEETYLYFCCYDAGDSLARTNHLCSVSSLDTY